MWEFALQLAAAVAISETVETAVVDLGSVSREYCWPSDIVDVAVAVERKKIAGTAVAAAIVGTAVAAVAAVAFAIAGGCWRERILALLAP